MTTTSTTSPASTSNPAPTIDRPQENETAMSAPSSTTTSPASGPASGPTPVRTPGPARTPAAGVSFARLVKVELRKMFDTRSGFWLMASIAILAVMATGAVLIWGPEGVADQNAFSSAIGIPMSILLPVIAVLTVTGEYTQRTGLTTYTLVPRRGRVIAAKLVTVIGVGVVSMFVALAVGALGTLAAGALQGVDPLWNLEAKQFALIVLANVLGMLMGFMLGAVTRNSAAAIVGYFVYSFVWQTLSSILASAQDWWADARPWFDGNYAITLLFDNGPKGAEGWAQFATATSVFLWVPLAVGLWMIMRAEVK